LDRGEELISNYNEEKIYLHPNKIFPTDHGLVMVASNNEEIILPPISSDSNGCFIKVGFEMPTGRFAYCPHCKQAMPFDINGYCIRCGTKIR
jgi:hypothetical protein